MRADGKRTGSVPYGYDEKNGMLIENKREMEMLALVLEYREAGMSLEQIAKMLVALGFRNKVGKPVFLATQITRFEVAARHNYKTVSKFLREHNEILVTENKFVGISEQQS